MRAGVWQDGAAHTRVTVHIQRPHLAVEVDQALVDHPPALLARQRLARLRLQALQADDAVLLARQEPAQR